MARQFVYGDSYGDIANRELAMDAATTDRFFRSLQMQNVRAQMAEAQQQEAQRQAFEAAKMLENNRRFRLQGMQDQESQRYNRSQDFLRHLFANREFDQKERLARLGLAARDQTGDQDYSEALGMVETGLPPSEAARMFRFNPTQLARLQAHYANKARLEDQELAPQEAMMKSNQAVLDSLLENERRTIAARRLKAEEQALRRFSPFTRDETMLERARQLPVEQLPILDPASDAAILSKSRQVAPANLPRLSPEAFNRFLAENIMKARLDTAFRGDPVTQTIQPIPVPRRFAVPRSVETAPASAVATNLLRQAQEAIARGADPAKVMARLRELEAQ